MRRLTIAVAVLLISFPAMIRRDDVFDASDAMGATGRFDAVARVYFEEHVPVSSKEVSLTRHTVTVLGIFKNHQQLPLPPRRVEIIETQGFLQTEEGNVPCWDNERPLPAGTEAMVFLRWDSERRAFFLGTVAYARVGQRSLRILRSWMLCDLIER